MFIKVFVGGLLASLLYPLLLALHHVYIQRDMLRNVRDPFRDSLDRYDSCDDVVFEDVRTVRHVHDFKTASAIIAKANEPILFKGYINNPQERWQKIEDQLDGVEFPLALLEIVGFGNMWLGGADPAGMVNTTLKKALYTPYDSEGRLAMYASFMPFPNLTDSADETTPTNVVKDTNFLSNFPQDVLATHIHAAPLVHSYSIQLVGRKGWVMVPPTVMETFDPICVPATFPLDGSERALFDRLSPLPVVLQEPGDFLYFPPHWGHAVMTKAGPNVMLNYRRVASNPLDHWPVIRRGMEGVLSAVFDSSHFSHVQKKKALEDYKAFSMPHREKNKDPESRDSPCAGRWKEMLNK